MGQTLSVLDRLRLRYLAYKEEADKRAAIDNQNYWDARSEGRVSLLGRLRRYPDRKKIDANDISLFLLQSFFVKEPGIGLWAALGAMFFKAKEPIFDLASNFKLEAQYVSAELASTLQLEADKIIEAVKDPATCEEKLRKQALEKNGIIFCQDLSAFAISAKRLNELRRDFKCSHGSHHIHVFREITQINTMRPSRRITGEAAPKYLYE